MIDGMKKKDMCARASAILFSGIVTPDDDGFLRELIKRHPDAAAKIGWGISRFEIRKNKRFGGPDFWLIRDDGTEDDFSYRTCVKGAKASKRAEILEALRAAIAYQVIEFKRHTFKPGVTRCSITGELLASDNIPTDHDPPFVTIARKFLEEVWGC